jgi:phosphoglycerol transferase MdoB-like AlkP superfamily enzyme
MVAVSFIRYEEFIWRYRRVISVVIVVVVIQFFELLLLHYKYNIFTGGFLQPYSYLTFFDRVAFIGFSLWFDSVFFGVIAVTWFFIVDRLGKHGIYIYYVFSALIILIMGGWLGFKFKVLSYFNDTVNFLILQNLGGGSFKDALLYAGSEIVFFVALAGILIIFFILSSRFLARFDYVNKFPTYERQQTLMLYTLLLAVLLTPVVTKFVSNNPLLMYGLEKKTSFHLVSKSLDKLSDVDFDGFGSFSFPRDPEIFNARVFPGALDIPGNGIDEDGFLGDAYEPVVAVDSFTKIKPKKGKHIILIVLESARADLLEKKLDGQYVAPMLREIAKAGTAVSNAYSHTGYTTTSLKAIFNRNLIGQNNDNLLGFLQRSGYHISIISGQDESFGDVARLVGMKAKGIDYFDARTAIEDRVYSSKDSGSLRLSEERVIEQFNLRIGQLDFSQPQFIYLNFQAAHFPYSHSQMTKRITETFIPRSKINIGHKREVSKTYWNAIANADWATGQVWEQLKNYGVLEDTIVVILGDHGESLFEDSFLGHGHAINDSQTRIPLIINTTDVTIDEAIGQVDVAELAVRSALGLKNVWANSDKTVFQLVGSLDRPLLIAHVSNSGARTIFDFRTEQFFFSEGNLWLAYEQAVTNKQYQKRTETLIRDWESLRWQAHLERSKKKKLKASVFRFWG